MRAHGAGDGSRAGHGPAPTPEALLSALATRLRTARRNSGLSRRALAAAAEVSERYIAQLETARGNASIALLARLAAALDLRLAQLLDPDPLANAVTAASAQQRDEIARILAPGGGWQGRIALIGLRGAGKSTIGPILAQQLGLPFRELNGLIAEHVGIPAGEVIALYGEAACRRHEREALAKLANGPALVLAVAGGLVADRQTYDMLRKHFLTIWLQATPEDHMARVQAQGDDRPMRGNPKAMEELRSILAARAPAYGLANLTLNTSGHTPAATVTALLELLAPHLDPPSLSTEQKSDRAAE